jgi:hypothetical protein
MRQSQPQVGTLKYKYFLTSPSSPPITTPSNIFQSKPTHPTPTHPTPTHPIPTHPTPTHSSQHRHTIHINNMKFTLAASALAISSVAGSPYFGLLAARSASPIHLQSINAAAQRLWIGRETSTYCPDVVEKCPPGDRTNFALSEDGGSMSMGAIVPGGQLVWVDSKTGAVG